MRRSASPKGFPKAFARCFGLLSMLAALPVGVQASTALRSALQAGNPRTTRAAADLTAYRPQHGVGYAPFSRTPVPEALEESATLGPGIRMHGAGEIDPSSEDDLIEVVVQVWLRNVSFVLERSSTGLRVWTTREKLPGSEITFSNGRSAPLPLGAASSMTLWVEWTAPTHGLADLYLVILDLDRAIDRLTFHSFRSIVMALGGEDQAPGAPVDPNHGSFIVAAGLYQKGYDVHAHDEDDVAADGTGPVYDEVVNAIQNRGVLEVVSFGYSHGGGSTHDLVERLDVDRPGIGTFSIPFTSYVDGIQNDSDIDLDRELRLPPTSAYHANHYQRGTFADFFLDGGPISGSNPIPSGLDVETTPWGVGATHFLVDDYVQVLDFISANLTSRVNR